MQFRTSAFFFLSLLSSFYSLAQADMLFNNALKLEVDSFVAEEKLDKATMERSILLPMPYASPNLVSERVINEIKSGKIKAINLYYTDYPKGGNLDLLNTNRIRTLAEAYEAVLDSDILWTVNRQMACKNKEEANEMFHGFEIVLDVKESDDLAYYHLQSGGEKFIVDEVFDRNNWDSMLVVADFTGSMSSYISQLLLWVKLNHVENRITQFIFFNDGNGRSQKYKLTGKTGGIYPVNSPIYREIEYTAKKCRKAGDGGDIPENDIEALLAGMRICKTCKEVILIADNKSGIRDFMLSDKLNKPVRIVLCGVEGRINPIYLNLARRTGGSVHLMEKDLQSLASINEGTILEVNGYKYQISGGQFIVLEEEELHN